MSASMAEVIRAHRPDPAHTYPRRCVCGGFTEHVGCGREGCGHGFPAHQAEQLAANGYGKLEDAWEAGYRQAKSDHCDMSPTAEYCDIESENPHRRPQ